MLLYYYEWEFYVYKDGYVSFWFLDEGFSHKQCFLLHWKQFLQYEIAILYWELNKGIGVKLLSNSIRISFSALRTTFYASEQIGLIG